MTPSKGDSPSVQWFCPTCEAAIDSTNPSVEVVDNFDDPWSIKLYGRQYFHVDHRFDPPDYCGPLVVEAEFEAEYGEGAAAEALEEMETGK